jgi:hypothetical protein
MSTRFSSLRRTLLVGALAALTACAGGPVVLREPGTSTRQARLALELAHERGPVRGRVQGLDAAPGRDVESRVLDVMADAVPALSVRFETDAPELTPVLVVSHGLTGGADPCAADPSLRGDPLRVIAAFCDATGAIGAVSGTLESVDDQARTRLYRALARELFPDLYPERYGIGAGPFNVYLGATFGF